MIGINEAIVDYIHKLLNKSNKNIDDLIKSTNISRTRMHEYLSGNKNLPLTELCIIARSFGLGIEEFLIKAGVLNDPNSNKINPQDIINFKLDFMSLWDEKNLGSQNFN